MERWTFVLALVAMALPASAQQSQDTALLEASLRQQWAGIDEQIKLRRIDQEALHVAEGYRSGEGAGAPREGSQGRVVFEFGATVPRIICRPERVCDIELQPGEQFVGEPMVGDGERWIIEPAMGGGAMHVVVKPKYPNVSTNLAVYTDRRVYHLELQATEDRHMPFVSFSYPEDRKARWLKLAGMTNEAQGKSSDGKVDALGHEHETVAAAARMNFNYAIDREGRRRARKRIDWQPVRAFDDGEKTFIEMPRRVLARELPILLVRDARGEDQIVNYRVKGTHFVVDRLFRKAVLVKGVGRRQERVGIERED